MKFIRWVSIPENNYKRAVKIGRAINFELVSKSISLKLITIAFQEKNM